MLEGTLESFTLPDIFQLLAFTRKDGCLVLRSDTDEGRVYFKEGQVYYGLSSHGALALGRRLVGAGLVGKQQLEVALAEQTEARRDGRDLRLGQILVTNGALEAAQLETFVREQIQDAVFDLMRWQRGAFVFESADEGGVIDEPIELAVSVENLIMEGSRRLEEWDQVKKKVPSMSAVVAMAPLPGDSGVEVSLQPEEWRLLTLVDGRRTVRGLIDLFGQGEFATCKILYGLVGAGLLEIRDPETDSPLSIAALLEQQELLASLEDGAGRPPPEPGRAPEPAPEPESAPEPEPEPEPAPEPEPEPEPEAEPEPEPARAGARALSVKVSDGGGNGASKRPEQRLTTDPSIDADLVQRLIDGVKGL